MFALRMTFLGIPISFKEVILFLGFCGCVSKILSVLKIGGIAKTRRITRTARSASELILKPAGAQGSQGPLAAQLGTQGAH